MASLSKLNARTYNHYTNCQPNNIKHTHTHSLIKIRPACDGRVAIAIHSHCHNGRAQIRYTIELPFASPEPTHAVSHTHTHRLFLRPEISYIIVEAGSFARPNGDDDDIAYYNCVVFSRTSAKERGCSASREGFVLAKHFWTIRKCIGLYIRHIFLCCVCQATNTNRAKLKAFLGWTIRKSRILYIQYVWTKWLGTQTYTRLGST